MCGIVGYVGHRPALPVVVEALRRMEYRGYDSAGVAVLDGSGASRVEKKEGKLANLEAALAAALRGGPALVLIETPSNPLMRVVDIRAVSTRAKAAGAKVAVDNTFLSPALQRPIALGADYVIHSTTKYLNGHSDVVGGAVVAAGYRGVDDPAAFTPDGRFRTSDLGRWAEDGRLEVLGRGADGDFQRIVRRLDGGANAHHSGIGSHVRAGHDVCP